MVQKNSFLHQTFLFVLLFGLATSTTFISDYVFESHGSTGRSLLQARKTCLVNFEFMNYTMITSKCKGPEYPPKQCCDSFTEFACPYTEYINDLSNDCASAMFSYINLYGNYPPGLFASECKGDKKGLKCPDNSTRLSQKDSTDASAAHVNQSRFSQICVLLVFVVWLLFF